jgi:HKD family nuclease
MKTRLHSSTPLQPLAKEMQSLSKNCVLFWGASAFVTVGAVQYVIDSALSAGAKTRFLTGTFGRTTRKSTFEYLLDRTKQPNFKARIWNCGSHRNFHAKLYLWRLHSGEGVVWVGSANLTDGGLQNQGELIFEIRAEWDSPTIRRLRKAFTSEWRRGRGLSKEFVNTYRESKRLPPDSAPTQNRIKKRALPKLHSRFFVTSIAKHFPDGSPISEHVNNLFGGTAEHWVRHKAKSIFNIRQGDLGLICDTIARVAKVVEVTDVIHEEDYCMFAYEPFVEHAYARGGLSRIKRAGISIPPTRSPRTRWIDAQSGKRVIKEMMRAQP